MRLVRLLELAFFREYQRLINDNIVWLGQGFAATNSDFYKNPERRESYGCIVANMPGFKYTFIGGQKLFVSRQTISEVAEDMLAIKDGVLCQCETVNSFKRFDGAHTGAAVGRWLAKEHELKGLLPQYVAFHCTDGASNAVASKSEYDLLTEMNRSSPINHNKCLAHQANRSAKYASGTGDFQVCRNQVLCDILKKVHVIVARVHKSPSRIAVIKEYQRRAKRAVVVLPSPSVPTRWDSTNREVSSLNRIMGDFNKGLLELINGNDKGKLTPKDGRVLPFTDFTFTSNDQLVLRQFECGSEPCVLLSKFYQINDATSHETLFVTTAYLAMLRQTFFCMYDELSHTEAADLKGRVKSVYVTSTDHVSTEQDCGRNEKPMDPCIQTFRRLYADDMAKRCGLTEGPNLPSPKLPVDCAIALLLNPMYGGKFGHLWQPFRPHTSNDNCFISFALRQTVYHFMWIDE